MTGPTVTYRTTLRRQPESRLTTPSEAPCTAVSSRDAPAHAAAPATPIARLLALAHHIERQIETGELKDYAEAAQRLGMAKSHLTHVTNLLSLAPDIQEAILAGRLTITEHALRPISRPLCWDKQRAAIPAGVLATIATDA